MTDAGDDGQEQSVERYDPYEFVPDRIDQVTASGLEQLHDAFNTENAARLRSVSVETQANLLWKLVEEGEINLTIRSEGGDR